MADQIYINVGATPRGQGPSGAGRVGVQSIRGSFAWGGAPGSLTIVFVNNGAPSYTGSLIEINIGANYFAGICKSDTANVSSKGGLREMQFVDMREFLTWDYVWCAFNMPIRRWVNGVWQKYYWHIYPADFNTYTKTFTAAPLPASAIVGALLTSPTVGTGWVWNLTGNGLFPEGLMNQPVYSFDCLNGVRLDAALNDISDRGGLVYTLQPTSQCHFRLVWMRKGYGLLPVLPPFDWPANSDDRRLGLALSGNATNIRVTGERNRYLVLNVPLTPNWNPAWQQFLTPDSLFMDIFQNEKDPVSGYAYTAYPGDTEQWQGANAAKVRALQITVSEYVDMRNSRSGDGDQFIDVLKYAGRSRMDMPAALYIEALLFRAYVPNVPGIVNNVGALIGLDSVNILDAMPCRVTYDPATGAMEADETTLADGNGVGIVQGQAFGQDLFELVKPERVSSALFSVTNRPWGSVSFQIDDSGMGQRYIIFEQPCFTSENLLVTVNGFQVMNANPTLNAAAAQAALTFELEPYSYWKGTYPEVGRDRGEYVAGLFAEYVGAADDTGYDEILYANGATADEQADQIASSLLLCQYAYLTGGLRLAMTNNDLAVLGQLSSLIDRVEVEFNPQGFIQITDFTTERERAHFEPERDLERKTVQNTLFPGQQQLRQQAREYQRLGAGLKGMTNDQMKRFTEFLKGNFDANTISTRFPAESPTGTLPAGTPLCKPPADNSTNPPTDTLAVHPAAVDATTDLNFIGVTTTQGQNTQGMLYCQTSGECLARVQGPVNPNDPIGLSPNGGTDFSTNGAYLTGGGTPAVGVALGTISDTSIQLIKVMLGSGGASGTWQTPDKELDPTVAVSQGTWVYISPKSLLAISGMTDAILGRVVVSPPGIWEALQDVPAQTSGTTPTYNVPQDPVPGANTAAPSGTPLAGDLDSAGVFWVRIQEYRNC